MKINVLHSLGSVNRGGTETLVKDILSNWKSEKYELLFAHRSGGVFLSQFVSDGISVIDLSYRSKSILSFLFFFRKTIKKNNIKIIHTHQSLDLLFAFITTLGLRTKLVLNVHHFPMESQKLPLLIYKTALYLADKVLFVSVFQKKTLVGERMGKYSTLANAVDFKKLDFERPTNIRKEFNIPEEHLLLGTVGNFTAGRDHFFLCQFLKILSASCKDFHFLFIGKASETAPENFKKCQDFCIEHKLSNILFLGSREDVPQILRQLDAFLYASIHDTFGIAVLEAMASNIPVFVNDWPVMEEISHGQAMIYKTNDMVDLQAKLQPLLENPGKFKTNFMFSGLKLKEEYGINKYNKGLEEVYNQLV